MRFQSMCDPNLACQAKAAVYEYVGRMGERCMWQQTPGADDTVFAADRGLMAPAMGSNPEVSR